MRVGLNLSSIALRPELQTPNLNNIFDICTINRRFRLKRKVPTVTNLAETVNHERDTSDTPLKINQQ